MRQNNNFETNRRQHERQKHNTVSRILHIDISEQLAIDLDDVLNDVNTTHMWELNSLKQALALHIGQTCDNCNHFGRELDCGDIIACGHPAVNFKTTYAKAFRKDGCPMWEPRKKDNGDDK